MPLDNSSNAPPTAQTSPNAPQPTESESAFLARQAAEAKRAVRQVLSDVAGDLTKGADPRAWMRVAPWTTLATAALAGFVATAAAVPTKEEQTLRRLRKIELAMREEPARDGDSNDRPRRSSFLTMLAGQLFKSLQPIVMNAISAGLTSKASQAEGGTDGASSSHNGHDPTPTASTDEPPGT